jgi:hypothetical protein
MAGTVSDRNARPIEFGHPDYGHSGPYFATPPSSKRTGLPAAVRTTNTAAVKPVGVIVHAPGAFFGQIDSRSTLNERWGTKSNDIVAKAIHAMAFDAKR